MTLASLRADADVTKAQCGTANAKGQSLRREGRLAEARQQFRICSDAKCTSLVSADCIARLDELEAVQPTVVFDVKDPSGRDLEDVEVTVDGRALLRKLDGSATPLDLGEHSFTFTAQGLPPVTRKLVLRDGERLRKIDVALEPAAPSGATSPPTSKAAEVRTSPNTDLSNADSSKGGKKTLGFVVAGTGVTAIVTGAVFGAMAMSAKTRQTNACSSALSCTDRDLASTAHEDATRYGTISTIALVTGAAATTLGIVLIATAKPAANEAPSTRVMLAPNAALGAAGLRVVGEF